MALPKWTDERTDALTNFVGDESPVSQATVAEAAGELETSTRSISSKLRKMGHEVELASASATRAFSDAQEATLSAVVRDKSRESCFLSIAKRSSCAGRSQFYFVTHLSQLARDRTGRGFKFTCCFCNSCLRYR
jgi:hypothetical protein